MYDAEYQVAFKSFVYQSKNKILLFNILFIAYFNLFYLFVLELLWKCSQSLNIIRMNSIIDLTSRQSLSIQSNFTKNIRYKKFFAKESQDFKSKKKNLSSAEVNMKK